MKDLDYLTILYKNVPLDCTIKVPEYNPVSADLLTPSSGGIREFNLLKCHFKNFDNSLIDLQDFFEDTDVMDEIRELIKDEYERLN